MEKAKLISYILILLLAIFTLVTFSSDGAKEEEERVVYQQQMEIPKPSTEPIDQEKGSETEGLVAGVFLRDPAEQDLAEGAMAYARSVEGETIWVSVYEGDGTAETQLREIIEFISDHPGGVFIVQPTDGLNLREVAQLAEEAKIYWCSVDTRQDNVYPMDYLYYVSHQEIDNRDAGYETAMQMLEQLESGAPLFVLYEENRTASSLERQEGLSRALNDIDGTYRVAAQATASSREHAYTLVGAWLEQYPEVGGIWCAGQEEALGARDALAAMNRLDVWIAYPDATPKGLAELAGDTLFVSVFGDKYYEGGYALLQASEARLKIEDVTQMPTKERLYYIDGQTVLEENVEEIQSNERVLTFANLENWCKEAIPITE